MIDRYVALMHERLVFPLASHGAGPMPTVVYTAMHGVGTPFVLRGTGPRTRPPPRGHGAPPNAAGSRRQGGRNARACRLGPAAFAAYGLPAPVLVDRQCTPDPDFPTVKYPNPEEGKGALQLAMDTGGPCLARARAAARRIRARLWLLLV